MTGNAGTRPTTSRIGKREVRWGEKTLVMGVINVTADSFSGDALGDNADAAVSQGLRMVEEGADILDVGGESTRPSYGARAERRLGHAAAQEGRAVDVDDELRRVLPVIETLAARTDVPISVDTYKPEVARWALDAGASMLNDVWGVVTERNVAPVAAERGVPIVLMDNQAGTEYQGDPVAVIIERLAKARDHALALGVPRENVVLDPGFGFGKNAQTNLALLRRLAELGRLGQPVLVGTSRKSTIGLVLGLPFQERMEGTAATVALAIAAGADIVRVHDVKEMARVARMADAVVRGWTPPEA